MREPELITLARPEHGRYVKIDVEQHRSLLEVTVPTEVLIEVLDFQVPRPWP